MCISTIQSCHDETKHHPINSAWLTLSDVSLEWKTFHSCVSLNRAEAAYGDLWAKQMWLDASVNWLYSDVFVRCWCYQQPGSLSQTSQTKKIHTPLQKQSKERKRKKHGFVHLKCKGSKRSDKNCFQFFFFLPNEMFEFFESLEAKTRPEVGLHQWWWDSTEFRANQGFV